MLSRLRGLHPVKIAVLAGVIVGGSAVAAGAAPAHKAPSPPPPVAVVTSVNGVSTAGTCGTGGAPGSFTMVDGRLNLVTVEVTTGTSFTDTADKSPSFADVCVAKHVVVVGIVGSDGNVTASSITVLAPAVVSTKGVVTSVNGVSTANTCGVAGASTGTYTFVGQRLRIVTVAVTSKTAFTDVADLTPSFADVCVGNHVKTVGTFTSGVLTATSVAVQAPSGGRAQGLVTSVNGVANAGTCGGASSAGSFNLAGNGRKGIVTIEVSSKTTFIDAGASSPSFADVCVGTDVTAIGVISTATLTAASVTVVARHIAQPGHGRHGRR